MNIIIDKITKELIGFTENSITDNDKEVIDIGSDITNGWINRQVTQDGVVISGTVFTSEQIDAWKSRAVDKETRKQKIISELQTLIGLSVANMTDAQRWKLVAVLLYAHGIINGNGTVLSLEQWDILE
jgi:hypothetical protein